MTGVKAMKQTMFDEFEVKGVWWIPDNPSAKVAGILFYSESKIHLELIGSLSDDYLGAANERYEIIHGVSDSGEEFSLVDVFVSRTTINTPGFQTEAYTIHSFIVGGHFETVEKIHFHSLCFFPTYLTEWLSRGVFTDTTIFEKGSTTFNSKQVTFQNVPTFSTYVEKIGATIKETYFTNFKTSSSKKVIWTNKSGLEIVPNENKDLTWFRTNMYLLKDILNLFIGHAIYFESIIFYGEEERFEYTDKKPRKKYMYFFRQDKPKIKSKLHWYDVIVSFKDIELNLSDILNSWFEKHNELEVVYDLHFAEFYKDLYINTSFLNTIQIIEIYHRKMYEGKVYDKREYRDLTKELKRILNESFPENYAKIIGDKLNYGNEYSLSMRIKEIINSFQEASRNLFIGSEEHIDNFVRQLVDTRNYLTHYDSDKKKNILHDSMDKYFAIQRLRAIATLLLYLEIGLDEELMVSKICESKQFSYGLSKAKLALN
ncbi:ApeA N-terminal domain 1-containing protein [Bacillus altitudinis]|uniref:ApeA N-terminal domain 1-containing protein n=2 Tax=Bacillus TaxID=1386 RepID=UPI002DBF5E6C|nr:HEPN domain-containing protein [Bacillus altitudinis]MEC1011539.1 hypothetical protein [Bacillus altitudinis]